jgi:hypothetical protein
VALLCADPGRTGLTRGRDRWAGAEAGGCVAAVEEWLACLVGAVEPQPASASANSANRAARRVDRALKLLVPLLTRSMLRDPDGRRVP